MAIILTPMQLIQALAIASAIGAIALKVAERKLKKITFR